MKKLTISGIVKLTLVTGAIILLSATGSVVGLGTKAYESLHHTTPTHGNPPDAQSTTGPVPPSGVNVAGALAATPVTTTTIAGVPTYIWRHGCGPTAAGMVIGYWDSNGYDALVSGDAYTQTSAVDEMIASEGPASNYTDYCEPKDYYPDPIQPDLSQDPPGDEHADECVADYMKTSQSYHYNYYGWSWFSDIGSALGDYSRQALGPGDDFVFTENLYMLWDGSLNWDSFRAEIDAGRPMVLLVDTDASGGTDHFVPAIGYGVTGEVQYYACLNTWDHTIHWFEFAPMAEGQAWGIYGGVTFRILTLDNHVFCPLIIRN